MEGEKNSKEKTDAEFIFLNNLDLMVMFLAAVMFRLHLNCIKLNSKTLCSNLRLLCLSVF